MFKIVKIAKKVGRAIEKGVEYTEEQLSELIHKWTSFFYGALKKLNKYLADDRKKKEELIDEARSIRRRVSKLQEEISNATHGSNVGTKECLAALDEVNKHLSRMEKWID